MLSTLVSGLLAVFPGLIGLPGQWFFGLAGLAALFAAYSWSRFFAAGIRDYRPWVLGIIIANAAYCLLVIALAGTFREQLTTLGRWYFAGELLVIGALVGWEVSVWRRLSRRGGC